jgi:hypothetical protein
MLNFFRRAGSSKGSVKSPSSGSGKMPMMDVSDPEPSKAPLRQVQASSVPPPADMGEIQIPDSLPKVSLEDFDLLKVLGKGGFGKVMLVRKKGTTDVYAMKVLKKEAVIRRNQVAHTKTETQILKQIRHPFLTRMHFGACAGARRAPEFACLARKTINHAPLLPAPPLGCPPAAPACKGPSPMRVLNPLPHWRLRSSICA